jgi:hypothetical protein
MADHKNRSSEQQITTGDNYQAIPFAKCIFKKWSDQLLNLSCPFRFQMTLIR